MADTIHHMPYDVQVRLAWGDTIPTTDIDPLTGDEWNRVLWKGARADRVRKGVGTVSHLPGARVGGSNPSAHREFLGRPRIIPTIDEFDYDEAAERAYEAEKRALDEYAEDLYRESFDDDGTYEYRPYDWYVECDLCGGPCEA